jgi:sodium-coupled neutral amino acid transporter 9
VLNKIFGLEIDAKDLTPEFSRFSSLYLGIILCFVLFPLIIKKDIGFIVKLSSFGIYFISILIIFVLYTGISSIINTKFDFDYITNKLNSEKRHLKLFGENPALFAGTLSMAYFSHTTVLPVLKSNKNQENNIRDLSLGYYFACFTFSFSGILGYIGFSGKNFDIEFKENWFLFFDYDNYFILLLRLLNVFQLITVFPIIIYVVRFQIFNYFYGSDYPGRTHIMIFGSIIIFICLIVLYFCYNFLAKLIGIIGATTSLVLIYGFPPIIKMIDYYFILKGDKIDDNDNEKN